jgi:hypothetical protein
MRKLGWNKRGADDDLWNAITLIAGAAVGIFFVFLIFRFSSTERANLVFFTKDAAMLSDAILSTPQNVEFIYPQQFPNKYALYQDNAFQVFTSSDVSGLAPYAHYFVPRRGIIADNLPKPLSFIYFLKNASFITVSNIPWTAVPQVKGGGGEGGAKSSETQQPLTPEEQAEKARLEQLYQKYLLSQSLCFKEQSQCLESIRNNYADACKEFNCLCGTSETTKISGRCSNEQPYFIVGLNVPKELVK